MSSSYEHVHMWRMRAVSFESDGTWTEYACELCGEEITVLPGGIHPEEC